MKSKEKYTHKELVETMLSYKRYSESIVEYEDMNGRGLPVESNLREIDRNVEDCEKRIPKSLFNKLEIKSKRIN